jgi:hypothetical protein
MAPLGATGLAERLRWEAFVSLALEPDRELGARHRRCCTCQENGHESTHIQCKSVYAECGLQATFGDHQASTPQGLCRTAKAHGSNASDGEQRAGTEAQAANTATFSVDLPGLDDFAVPPETIVSVSERGRDLKHSDKHHCGKLTLAHLKRRPQVSPSKLIPMHVTTKHMRSESAAVNVLPRTPLAMLYSEQQTLCHVQGQALPRRQSMRAERPPDLHHCEGSPSGVPQAGSICPGSARTVHGAAVRDETEPSPVSPALLQRWLAYRPPPARCCGLPLSQCVPGAPFLVDSFSRESQKSGTRAFFLTHFHYDHFRGLSKGFSSGTIYCTAETARLVQLRLKVQFCAGPALSCTRVCHSHAPAQGPGLSCTRVCHSYARQNGHAGCGRPYCCRCLHERVRARGGAFSSCRCRHRASRRPASGSCSRCQATP